MGSVAGRYTTPASTAARSRCASGRYLCPQTVTARRAGRPRGCYLGMSGPGDAVEALRRSDGIRQDIRGRSERSASPDPLGPMDTSSTSRGRCGGGGGHRWGARGRHAGGLSGFGAPRAKIGCPSMFLTIGCGRQISGPPGSWAEVGFQGVPQTGKIFEVKR